MWQGRGKVVAPSLSRLNNLQVMDIHGTACASDFDVFHWLKELRMIGGSWTELTSSGFNRWKKRVLLSFGEL